MLEQRFTKICDALRLDAKKVQILKEEEVDSVSDLLRLSAADLVEMKFGIGAKNRVLSWIAEQGKYIHRLYTKV